MRSGNVLFEHQIGATGHADHLTFQVAVVDRLSLRGVGPVRGPGSDLSPDQARRRVRPEPRRRRIWRRPRYYATLRSATRSSFCVPTSPGECRRRNLFNAPVGMTSRHGRYTALKKFNERSPPPGSGGMVFTYQAASLSGSRVLE